MKTRTKILLGAGLVVAAFVVTCAPSAPKQAAKPGGAVTSDIAVAAQKTFVPPGDLDEFYLFASGGHSGLNWNSVTSGPGVRSVRRIQ